MSVGRDTIGQAVDSSAIIVDIRVVAVHGLVQHAQEVDRPRGSRRPPKRFGIHSPGLRA